LIYMRSVSGSRFGISSYDSLGLGMSIIEMVTGLMPYHESTSTAQIYRKVLAVRWFRNYPFTTFDAALSSGCVNDNALITIVCERANERMNSLVNNFYVGTITART
jgi:hypothetical protein